MQIPVLSTIRELDPAPRRFLAFLVLNIVSWQCVAGSVLVLFARDIGMPPSWVGFLLSFMPLSSLLVVFTVPLVMRFGPKRLMMATWLGRCSVTCGVFLLPWAVSQWGPPAGWYVLMAATLGFCLLRAVGGGGWFPWLHEIIAPEQRGLYFSAEMSMAQCVGLVVMTGQALMLQGHPGTGRFLVVYAMGIAAGFGSLFWLARVPGGAGVPISLSASFGAYRTALADRAFLKFAATSAFCFSALSWLGASSVMYMRDALGLPPRTVMFLAAMGSLGVLLTIRSWARFAEHRGSGLALFKTLTAHGAMAAAYFALVPGAWWTPYLLAPIIALATIMSVAFWTVAHRTMLNYVNEACRPGYTNIWAVGSSLAMGVTPILAGQVIGRWGLAGFRACFLISAVASAVGAAACRFIARAGEDVPLASGQFLSPSLPVRTLARVIWITLGLDATSRPKRD